LPPVHPKSAFAAIGLCLAIWVLLFLVFDGWLLGDDLSAYWQGGAYGAAAAALGYNALVYALLTAVFAAILGRWIGGTLAAGIVYGVLSLACFLKLKNLGEPIYPWDYLSIPQFAGMSVGYAAIAGKAVAVLCLIALCLVALVVQQRRERRASRAGAAALAVVLAVASHFLFLSKTTTRRPGGVVHVAWSQADNLRANGLLSFLALNLGPALISEPPGYDRAAIQAICSEPQSLAPTGGRPADVVLVLDEAFTRIDRTFARWVKFNRELTPFFTSLKPGKLSLPTFGGFTANAEFEILTGTAYADLPSGSVPYQQYLQRTFPFSLPRLFERAGYRTIAVHPFLRTFWNRDHALRQLGFDQFLSIEDLGLGPAIPYVRDQALLPVITRLLDDDHRPPLFIFVITMENHGPWFAPRYEHRTVELEAAPADWTSAARESFANYGQGAANADAFLHGLVDYAKARANVVVAMFGDHHPTFLIPDMGNRNLMALPFGDPAKVLPADYAHRAIMETEYAIWPGGGPAELQAAFLGPLLAQRAGIGLDRYWSFIAHAAREHPVVQRRFVTNPDGAAADADDATVRGLRLLQYDLLFGRQYANSACK
jgi:hypothetical protein